ncbi:MAG: FliI/YscN family ATPase [Nitrospinaceae bacterium]|jgi:flagellum-specific ATP synthase|nr:FliI/YscN family ATPase [Nitrospina sp.]MDG1844490.1 FliI/YscN family ATPase [Nitrospinaceae bacterium]MBT5985412.1 FliI/YscN family ATPase [Nitrospina sp.]MBT6296883.1 FliI/YscN family ATPase [Nitrospina sp.]MBT6662543.1 FliI/YscN family ATPase [Nitrospina sp.]
MQETINIKKYSTFAETTSFVKKIGKISQIIGLMIESDGPGVGIGSICTIKPKVRPHILAQVVGFRNNKTLLMPLGEINGIEPGCVIEATEEQPSFAVSTEMIGRVLDGNGKPIDGKGTLSLGTEYPIMGTPINPLNRTRINQPLDVGVRSINGLITFSKGQRVGIMAGTGVGKSVLLGMIARNTEADINVIALIGERGREVKEFIEDNLGPEGLKRSIVIAAASDEPPLVRLRGAFIATTIAEYFRDQGKDVLLMMDSITRFALAQREIGLSVGEPPTTKGYPPSTFSMIPKLLERAGTSEGNGSITGLYTVLVEGDDLSEPVSDAVRAVLDGHIVLDRELAAHNHYPAIDILSSVSRLMIDVISKDHYNLSMKMRDFIATYNEAKDLINIGAYTKGSNPKWDIAINKIDRINDYLKQGIMETSTMGECLIALKEIVEK